MTTAPIEIHGTIAPGFERVKDTFAANFERGQEAGASFAATVDGEFVVDIWAGTRDIAGTLAWEKDTIVNVFSTTKATVALACATADCSTTDRRSRTTPTPASRW